MIILLNFYLIHINNINNIQLMTFEYIDIGFINPRKTFSAPILSRMSQLMSSLFFFNRLNCTYYTMLNCGIWWKAQRGVFTRGRRGRVRIVFESIATYAISVYHHQHCEFEARAGEVQSIQHYVIKLVSDLQLIGGSLRFPPPIKLTTTIYLQYCWKRR